MPSIQPSSQANGPSTQHMDSFNDQFGDPFMMDLANQYNYKDENKNDNFNSGAEMFNNFSEFEQMQQDQFQGNNKIPQQK